MLSIGHQLKLPLLAGLAAALALSGPSWGQGRTAPVVVELFQSQGCSSCPPANANVNAIADRPDILALSYGVTYWDKLGWKDTFASPQYTARQWDYAHSLGRPNVGTPQVVINGRRDLVGSDSRKLDAAIRTTPAIDGPSVVLSAAAVEVSAGRAPRDAATVWLIRYDPRIRAVPIRRGENGGKSLPHKNIVVEMTSIGRWVGKAAHYDLPAPRDRALATAILIQSGKAGPILAAVKG
jgi:hypothetical protein